MLIAQSAWLDDGLVAYYPFDGDAMDKSTFENHPISGSFVFEYSQNGKEECALLNQKRTQFKANLEGFTTNKTPRTYSLWFSSSGYRSDRILPYVLFAGRAEFDNEFFFGYRVELGRYKFSYWSAGKEYDFDGNEVSFSFERWHHICVVIDDSMVTLFLDGEFYASKIFDEPLAEVSSELLIGWNGDPDSFFGGKIDDFRVHTTALTSSHVRQLQQRDLAERWPSEYSIIPGEFTWSEARKDAELRGGHLASITSPYENRYILGLVERVETQKEFGLNLWIGGNDLVQERNWKWLTGEDWSYSNWFDGQPDNLGGNQHFALFLSSRLNGSLVEPGMWCDAPDYADWGNGNQADGYILEKGNTFFPRRKALASVRVVNGVILGAEVIDGGYGYTSNPDVTISGGGGFGAVATATVSAGQVVKINIINPGFGYTGDPTIDIDAPPVPPAAAYATAEVVNGFLVGATLVSGGEGYIEPPVIKVAGGNGQGAIVAAEVADGRVVAVNVLNPGSGYTSTPVITIAPPPTAPELSIRVTQVEVNMKLTEGKRYTIEASKNMVDWVQTGDLFTAEEQFIAVKFDVDEFGQFFRVIEQP